MRIDRLEPSKRKKGRILAYLSDGSILKLTEQELLDHGLRAGDELTEEQLRQLRVSAGCSDAKAEAARLLGRKPMSRADLEKKLRERGASEAETDYAAEWLTAIGALDDAAYAALLVRHYSASGYGPARCREELRRHGVDREFWEEALAGAPDTEETIARVLQSRWKGRQPDEKELKRASDALLRRGFAWGDVRAALRRYTDDCPETEP
ncbi:MAG: regulatory protein RecX [Oscillospiraceae bacterium]